MNRKWKSWNSQEVILIKKNLMIGTFLLLWYVFVCSTVSCSHLNLYRPYFGYINIKVARIHFLFESHFYDHFFYFPSLFHVIFFLDGSIVQTVHSISKSLWLSSMVFKKHTFIVTEIGYFHWNFTGTSFVYTYTEIKRLTW